MSKPAVMPRQRRTICQQRGTTMIEVIVAGLVLSAGLLGLAAMQTKAIKTASGLATQQIMVQALGAFGEARLAQPNMTIVNGTGPGGERWSDFPILCNSLWVGSSFKLDRLDRTTTTTSMTDDLHTIRDFLEEYTPCRGTALKEYADYWNQYAAGLGDGYGPTSSFNGTECDYIVPRTLTLSCTLPTGDLITLKNLVWIS